MDKNITNLIYSVRKTTILKVGINDSFQDIERYFKLTSIFYPQLSQS